LWVVTREKKLTLCILTHALTHLILYLTWTHDKQTKGGDAEAMMEVDLDSPSSLKLASCSVDGTARYVRRREEGREGGREGGT
jgi:hypothetical protein